MSLKFWTVLAGVALVIFAVGPFWLPGAQAQTAAPVNFGLEQAAGFGLATTDIRTIVVNIINVLLGLLGLLAVVLFIYAGFLWMTSQGDPEKVNRAKQIILQAIIGLLIIASAFAIVQFLFARILGGLLEGGGGGSARSAYLTRGAAGTMGTSVVEYHYPENGQREVPRNTKIAITFKKPLKRSSVFLNYFDNNTLQTDDDCYYPPGASVPTANPVGCAVKVASSDKVFALNTDNIKIIKTAEMGGGTSSDFATFYAKALTNTGKAANQTIFASITPLATVFDPNERQTVVITQPFDAPLGTPEDDVEYRVKLRGGEDGLRVWTKQPGQSGPSNVKAFPAAGANDAFYWVFTTNTTLDVTPPQVSLVIPPAVRSSDLEQSRNILDRNQLLQVYFNEPVDPTTAAGANDASSDLRVEARCRAGKSCDFPCGGLTPSSACTSATTAATAGRCAWVSGKCVEKCRTITAETACDNELKCVWEGACRPKFAPVPGVMKIGNRYRTAEFASSAPCEGRVINSCGEGVLCLPKNVELRVVAEAANVASGGPAASLPVNGITDMVGNSLDGNKNGSTEGPFSDPLDRAVNAGKFYNLNDPQSPSALKSGSTVLVYDTVRWRSLVGENIDLAPPVVTALDPKSDGFSGISAQSTYASAQGPSSVPAALPVSVNWSKTMSVVSMMTGTTADIVPPAGEKPTATVGLQMNQCLRLAAGEACPVPPAENPCGDLTFGSGSTAQLVKRCPVYLSFFTDVDATTDTTGNWYTVMRINHEPLLTANDLGFTKEEVVAEPSIVPTFAPVVGAQLRDTKQNCFYPSVMGAYCNGKENCCNLTGQDTFDCRP